MKNFGDQAVASPRRTYDAGFRDAQKLRGYDDLEPLHAREDYQKLLAAMEKK